MNCCQFLFALLCPPLIVGLQYGCCSCQLLLNILLTCCFWIPGVVHAFMVLLDEEKERRVMGQQQQQQGQGTTHTIVHVIGPAGSAQSAGAASPQPQQLMYPSPQLTAHPAQHSNHGGPSTLQSPSSTVVQSPSSTAVQSPPTSPFANATAPPLPEPSSTSTISQHHSVPDVPPPPYSMIKQ